MNAAIKPPTPVEGHPEIIYRKATAEDALPLTRLARALADFEGVPSRVTAADIGGLLSQPDFYYFEVAEIAGRIAAFVFAYPGYDLASASHGYHLADLYVAEPYRRAGIARRLMEGLGAQAKAIGGQWISWTVLQNNTLAVEFYHKLAASTIPVHFMALPVAGAALT